MYPDQPQLPRRSESRVLPLLTLLVGILLGFFVFKQIEGVLASKSAQPRMITPRASLTEEEQTNISIFETTAPSVTYITTKERRRGLFRSNVMERETGSGSGFIWDEQGHVVTNYHVIRDGNAFEVVLFDQTVHEATLIGFYPDKDIAVLKIDSPPADLQPIPLGTAHDLQVGQKVFAIGNPFGWDYTLTTGVISALNRVIPSFNNREIDSVIQTDAAINPGNSGGPLLDSGGRVIGVNTQIYTRDGSYVGIGFAIPVDTVNEVVPQLIRDGQVTRAGLGIQLITQNESLMRRLRIEGLMIRYVNPGSAAEMAGLQGVRRGRSQILMGDIIVEIGGQKVKNYADFARVLERYKVGETVAITFMRAGRLMKTELTLQAVKA